MSRRLNYRHLHHFWVVAREGSIARAAEALDLAPQTLSSQVSTFEADLGTRLFERRGRRLVMTDAGRTVFQYADPMFRTAEELEAWLDAADAAPARKLRVGIVASIHKLFAYRVIAPALETTTPVTLRCRTGAPEDLTSALARHDLDVVITDRPPTGDEDFRWYLNPLSQSAISLFAEPSLAQRLAPGFPASLDGFPFLASALDAPYYQQLMQWFRDQGIRVREAAEIDDSALIKVFGRAGLGVFAAPTLIREEVCRQYQVEEIASIETVRDQIYALYGVEGMRHPGIQAICSGS
ncbi:MAG: LysR family transcriptional regulator [Pseudomonadota bacterium]